MDILLAKGMKY